MVVFEIKLGGTGYESILRNAHNNLRPIWIHPLLRKGQGKKKKKKSLWGVSLL